MEKRATIKDVAVAAGVGVATVSRVLSGGSASPATRERVLAVAAQLDYRPSALGRNLRQRRTGGMGLLVPDLTDTFYGQLAEGVLACARSAGEPVVLGSTGGDPEQEADMIGMLLEQSVDRLIAVPSGDAETWVPAIRAGMTVVFADRFPVEPSPEPPAGPTAGPAAGPVHEGSGAASVSDLMALDGIAPAPQARPLDAASQARPLDVPAVVADDRAGIRTAVRYLRGLGHKRIAFLGGPGHDRRAAAFREAVGAPVDEELVVFGTGSRDSAYAAASGLFQSRPDLSAVVAGGNVLGEAAVLAARELDLRVPKDVSLVMYDDVPWAELCSPPLTVIAQPGRDMGYRAAELVLRTGGRKQRGVVLPTELIIRGSCGPRR
ncbi:LacI family DNA-binding transcriptional regulator [Nonomuraea phyllanthi]|uniref:LacI family DNA-binding transcriptional regulator n=1 Tax=Nonomuraea phyllanthi TaxID=2219224 RepID=A0A5C4W6P5_9ACTN|nr:LacI family DNA-binding transcriptional regulator [Nonomuraea phyllanthi]KAB8192363.1 LacI family DNA-binding transcriptional regulator [Nonomuraea phyllanthi]QFY11283.1 LacI family DNA-binding transcriptional regulator [Nonomuraea phyllanthi]